MCLFKYDIANSFGDGLGEHGAKILTVLDGTIVGTRDKYIRNVDA